jgi:hypothetical protein
MQERERERERGRERREKQVREISVLIEKLKATCLRA